VDWFTFNKLPQPGFTHSAGNACRVRDGDTGVGGSLLIWAAVKNSSTLFAAFSSREEAALGGARGEGASKEEADAICPPYGQLLQLPNSTNQNQTPRGNQPASPGLWARTRGGMSIV